MDMKSFKEFRGSVESRLHLMEEATIANSNIQKASLLSDNGIAVFENELKQKDAVIKFLTKKLVEDNCQVVNKGINVSVSLVISNDSEESSDGSKIIKNSCNGTQRERSLL